MIRNYEDYKPVKVGGQISILLGLLILVIHFFVFPREELEIIFDVFAWINIFWYLLMGIGILQQRIWSYYMLKGYLYVLAIGFPIGTYIGLKSLKYIKEKNIKDFFVGRILEF